MHGALRAQPSLRASPRAPAAWPCSCLETFLYFSGARRRVGLVSGRPGRRGLLSRRTSARGTTPAVAANTTAWYFNKKNARAWSRSGPSWLAQCEIENKAGVCKKKVVSKNSFFVNLPVIQLYQVITIYADCSKCKS